MNAQGLTVQILPGYNSETHCRDIWDDVAGCEASVLRDEGGQDLLVEIKGTWQEVWLNRGRCKLPAIV